MHSEQLQRKVLRQPTNPLLRFSLGQALVNEGHFTESVGHLDFCCKHDANWMMPRILLGKAYLASNSLKKAETVLNDALRLAIEQEHEEPAEEIRLLIAKL